MRFVATFTFVFSAPGISSSSRKPRLPQTLYCLAKQSVTDVKDEHFSPEIHRGTSLVLRSKWFTPEFAPQNIFSSRLSCEQNHHGSSHHKSILRKWEGVVYAETHKQSGLHTKRKVCPRCHSGSIVSVSRFAHATAGRLLTTRP